MSTRTRSDYHDLFNVHSTELSGISRWIKPLLWLALGLTLGMLYNKKDLHSCYNMLAAAEYQKSTVASTKINQKNVKQDLTMRV